ncbi:Membrane-associated zinc metalloprotease [Rubellimicrobium mesophilum DSM 19309]|uniref:Membrane-associated zinc metalloprotease n=1 Tax=Rubellimicrobium mesophilum DSM 19309 TaxID=442562 RepID=A0A017HRX7_9RHOB|nr:Membrane-associated zinc metalloprotease [Rubellimicrobium mesophilum DSM 19309]
MDPTQFLPQFGNAAFTLLAFVVALSIIVAIHEYGHYIVGRWTGIKAEVFSLGFGPVLFSRTDRHGTRWQVAALPFGGYVKFLGDANAASMGGAEDRAPAPERRHTMLGAPLWARVLTVAAGPFANFLLTILLFVALAMTQGRPVDPLTIADLAPMPDTYAQDLRPGDQILAIAGQPVAVATVGEVSADLPPGPTLDYLVRRDGEELTVQGPQPFPPIVGAVSPNSAAWDVGIQQGDLVLEMDGRQVWAFDEMVDIVKESNGRPLGMTVWRDGEELEFTAVPAAPTFPCPRAASRRDGWWACPSAASSCPRPRFPASSSRWATRSLSSGSSSPPPCRASATCCRARSRPATCRAPWASPRPPAPRPRRGPQASWASWLCSRRRWG